MNEVMMHHISHPLHIGLVYLVPAVVCITDTRLPPCSSIREYGFLNGRVKKLLAEV